MKGIVIRLMGAVALAATSVAAEPKVKPADLLDACNVVWDSPSTNSLGSMPLGNGDIGVNVWTEPNHNLGVGSGTQGAQTVKILEAYE